MLCSLAFVVAALAVTVVVSEPIEGATRALPNTRVARRSPNPELYPDFPSRRFPTGRWGGGNCFVCGGTNGFTQTQMTSIYQSTQFSSYARLSTGSGFADGGGIFPPISQGLNFNDWTSGTSSLAVLTNSMFGWAAYVQSTQISSTVILASFTNMFRSLSVCVQQFQSLGAFGGGGDFVSIYARTIVAIQGLLAYIGSSIGIQAFISLCGPIWPNFISIFTTFITFGRQWNIFQGNFFATTGINIGAFQAWGFDFRSFNSFTQSNSIAVGNFGSLIQGGSFSGLPISQSFGASNYQSNSFAAASASSSSFGSSSFSN